jgi:polyphosphate kinase
LVDEEIINLLYKASKTGVKIQLLIRGMCSLMPDKYPNIEAYGVVDRLLEHSRFFIFANGGDEKVFISSADLMTRNLDRRVEVICPVFDEKIKKIISELFDLHYRDNHKARILDDNQTNLYVPRNSDATFRSQEEIYRYLVQNSLKK